MKVAVCPADQGACGHYRLIWPAELLMVKGHDVAISYGGLIDGVYDKLDRMVGVAVNDEDVDVIVLQRPIRREFSDAVPLLQALGIAVVVEIDDDFGAVQRGNVAAHVRERDGYLIAACNAADLVTCTTPALGRKYASHGRVMVIPNMPLRRRIVAEPVGGEDFLGWSGSVQTHPNDLMVASAGVQSAINASDWRFLVIGTGKGVAAQLGLPVDVMHSTGWVDLDLYHTQLQRLDVGVVPLASNRFNRAKSALKMVEMAAAGVVPVASRTPDNLRIHESYGIGLMATTPREWSLYLTQLVFDDDRRRQTAVDGLTAVRQMAMDDHVDEWWTAWSTARSVRAGTNVC